MGNRRCGDVRNASFLSSLPRMEIIGGENCLGRSGSSRKATRAVVGSILQIDWLEAARVSLYVCGPVYSLTISIADNVTSLLHWFFGFSLRCPFIACCTMIYLFIPRYPLTVRFVNVNFYQAGFEFGFAAAE